MKTILTLFTLLSIAPINIVHGEPKTIEIKEKSFAELTDEFYSNVTSPSTLTLSIKDQATLDIAKENLEKNQKRIAQIAAEFKKFPVPDDATKRTINAAMEDKEKELKKNVLINYEKHLKEMPVNLSTQWTQALREFYKGLDQNKEVFTRYFAESKPKQE